MSDPHPSLDSATASAPISSSLPTVINPIQFHYSINPKLDESNFLLWKSQVLPVIRGHGLLSFLDSPPSASPGSSDSTGASDLRQRQDQLILSWLLSSLGPDVLPQAISCDISADLWRMLHSTYSIQSTARVLELKLKLQTLKKGNLTCTEFLNRLKSVALQLRSIGSAVSDQDLTLCLFAGLPPEYNSLVTSLTSQNTSFSIADLHGHLLNFESRLASQALSDPTAHLTFGDSSKQAPPPSFISNGAGSGLLATKPVNTTSVNSTPLLPTPLPTTILPLLHPYPRFLPQLFSLLSLGKLNNNLLWPTSLSSLANRITEEGAEVVTVAVEDQIPPLVSLTIAIKVVAMEATVAKLSETPIPRCNAKSV